MNELGTVKLSTTVTSNGPDRQTLAVQAAAVLLGGLISVGNEIRVLIIYDHRIWPIALLLSYLVVVFIVAGLRGAKRMSVAAISVNGKTESVSLRIAPKYLVDRIAVWASSMGLPKEPKVLVIPRTNSVLDGYAVGSAREPVLVLSGAAAILALRKDADSTAKLEILVRHELGHLLRDDPEVFDTIAAASTAAVLFTVIKTIIVLCIGAARSAAWYRILFPRTFSAHIPDGIITTVPTSTTTVLGAVLSISLTLGGILLVLRWVWVRRREYWADNIALRFASDREVCRASLQNLLTEMRLRKSLPSSIRRSGWWHPSMKSRLKMLDKASPSLGFYAGTGAILVILTIFAARYVLGNNRGFGLQDFPKNGLTFALSVGYMWTSFVMISWLVTPTRDRHFVRSLISLIKIAVTIAVITALVLFADIKWTLSTSHIPAGAPASFHSLVIGELLERSAMIVCLGLSLAVFAGVSFLMNAVFRFKKSLEVGGLASFGILLLLAHLYGAPFIYKVRSNITGLPYGMKTPAIDRISGDDACVVTSELSAPLAHAVAGLEGGICPFDPPLGCFLLNQGPRSAATWQDENLYTIPIRTRERLRNWYEQHHEKHPDFTMSDHSLLTAFSDLVKRDRFDYYLRRFPKRKTNPLLEGSPREIPTEEQRDLLNIALWHSTLEENPSAVRLAIELGADPNYYVLAEDGAFGPAAALAEKLGLWSSSLSPCARRCLQYLVRSGLNLDQAHLREKIAASDDAASQEIIRSRGMNVNPKRVSSSPIPLKKAPETPKPDLSNPVNGMLAKLKVGMTPEEVHRQIGQPRKSPENEMANSIMATSKGQYRSEEYIGSDATIHLMYRNGKLARYFKSPPRTE